LTEEPADSSDDGNICNTKTFCRKKRAEEKKNLVLDLMGKSHGKPHTLNPSRTTQKPSSLEIYIGL
jgi:hypothetical protein